MGPKWMIYGANGYTALRVSNLRVGAMRAVAVPTLSASLDGTAFRLSWPKSAVGYRLVQSSRIGGPWADANVPVFEVGDQFRASSHTIGNGLFFRLEKTTGSN